MTRDKAIETALKAGIGLPPAVASLYPGDRPAPLTVPHMIAALEALGLLKFEEPPKPLDQREFLVGCVGGKECALISGASIIGTLRAAGYRVEKA